MKAFNLVLFSLLISLVLQSQTINIKNPTEQYDYVIITPSYFTNGFDEFSEHKENVKLLQTAVITVDQIYSEFPNSDSNETSIREFISYAGKNWPEPQPTYFFLAGDIDAVPNFEIVRFLDDTVKTDYHYMIDLENDADESIDYYVGRISARTYEELQNYLTKVIEYESTPIESWNNNVLIAGFDGEDDGSIFQNVAINFSDNLLAHLKPDLYLSPSDYDITGFRNSIINGINIKGYSSVFFIGKSNQNQFGNPAVFDQNNIDAINTDYSPFVVFMGKQLFSSSDQVSLIDNLLFNRNGAIGGISPVGYHYLHLNSQFNKILCNNIYSEQGISIGESFKKVVNDEEFFFTFPRKDLLGIFGDPSLTLKFDILAATENDELVNEFFLHQNYPNPFNPTTVISFSLPETTNIELKIFDVLGREITTLIHGIMQEGNHSVEFDASELSSGIYLYQIRAGEFRNTKKMLLIR